MLSGLLLVNKPSGPTSFDLIRWLRRGHRDLKMGHAGTLDPLASGLMILLVGKATKIQDSMMKMDKTYLCGVQLGIKTDTGDREGRVTNEAAVPTLSLETLNQAAKKLEGPQMQVPPMYAAIKKGGVPLYKLARKGQTVEREARAITVHSFEILSYENLIVTFRVRCSSGTYVRTLAEDFAQLLGTVGSVDSLVREQVGPFSLDQTIGGEQLKTISFEDLASKLLPPPPSKP